MACAASLGVAGRTRFDPLGHCAVGAEALLVSPGRDKTSTDMSKNLACIPRKFWRNPGRCRSAPALGGLGFALGSYKDGAATWVRVA